MQIKRYKCLSAHDPRPDPSLEETLRYVIRCFFEQSLTIPFLGRDSEQSSHAPCGESKDHAA